MKAESPDQTCPDASGCFLCGRLQIRVVEQLSGSQLRALWKALGHEFTREAWGRIHEDYPVTMRQCLACGFTFFDPSLAGNEAFYRELEHPEYFTRARPEFQRTLQFARRRGWKLTGWNSILRQRRRRVPKDTRFSRDCCTNSSARSFPADWT